MKPLLPFFILLAACATKEIPFQKEAGGVGYSVENKSADNFLVRTRLPAAVSAESALKYVGRAVAEECLQRGFSFFDMTAPSENLSEGFCFKENRRRALAISFKPEPLTSSPSTFVIDNLNGKSATKLKPNDQLVKINGENVESLPNLKV